MLSIGINVVGQILMSLSKGLSDPFFDMAHVYKVLGYATPLLGFSLYQIAVTSELKRAQDRLGKQTVRLADLNRSLDRKVAERTQELKESSAKYRALFESSRDAVMLLDREGFIDCNPATLELFGCRGRDEFVKKHPSELSPPNQPDGKDSFIAAVEHIENAYETGKDFFEWMHQRVNGAPFPATVQLSRVTFNGQEVLQALVRDISERKWMEKALADEKERLSVTLQSIGDGVISTNRDGYVVSLNRAGEDLTGWGEHEAIGMPLGRVFFIVDERTRDRCEDPVQKVLKTGKIVGLSNHTILISKDGTEKFLGDSAAPVRDRDGNIVGAVLVFRDVTEARKAREALKRHAHDLGERVKELSCLYTVSRLAQKGDAPLADILQGTADAIPPSWQYPEVTCARVTLDGQTFATDNFDETAWKMTSDIEVHGEKRGGVEVYYLEEMPESDEGPFIKEERRLIDAIAERLGRIIERYRAEEELAEKTERLRVTLESIGDGVISTDTEGHIVSLNKAAEDLTGWREEEALGLPLSKAFHIVDEITRDRCEDPVQKVLKTGNTVGLSNHTVLISRDGTERFLGDSAAPIRDRDGNIVGAVLVFRDVTERKRAEQAIRESEERYRALFEGAVDGILIADVETKRFVHANSAMCEMLGYTEEELTKLTVSDIHPKDALERVIAEFEAQARGEKLLATDIPCLRKDGTVVYADINTAMTTIGARECNVGLFRDITKRRRMERELSQGQKLQAVGQLAAGIAHEINTPTQYVGDNLRFLQDSFSDLTKVMDKCDNLRRAHEKGEATSELVAELDAAAKEVDLDYIKEEIPNAFKESLAGVERVTKIVRAMKEFSHPGSAEKAQADINKAIESTVTVARNEWKYVADVEMDFDPELPPVPCILGDFNQVILNMIVNAAHAIAGVIGDGSDGKGKIKISTRRDGDSADIRVSDTGTGIPKEAQSRVFDPFFTTKQVGKGTGQGLAIAHDVIVEKHGGSLTFETEEGKGTTFIVRLPFEASAS
jgi:PAS domain S-box-containing protein